MPNPTLIHTIPPVFSEASRALILGSFPSAASRGAAFFYAHPKNRFWRVMAAICASPLPATIEEKTALLLHNGLLPPLDKPCKRRVELREACRALGEFRA